MQNLYSLSVIYTVKAKFHKQSNRFQKTEFKTSDALTNRSQALQFIENYLEIITNEGLVQINSNLINQKAIKQTNIDVSEPDERNFEKLKLFNQETIAFIPNQDIFPEGISLSFKITKNFEDLKKDKEYEIFSLKSPSEIDYSLQINNLIIEHKLLKKLNYQLNNSDVFIEKEWFSNLQINQDKFFILDTPLQWNNILKQLFINKIGNEELSFKLLYDHLINYEKYDYVNFLEENCLLEIEENIYAMLHEKGGILFVGYNPENLTESLLSDCDILDYYNLLDFIFSKDKYLYKNINLHIINYEDFAVLSIVVYPLNEISKINCAYNPNKIFIKQNNRIVRLDD